MDDRFTVSEGLRDAFRGLTKQFEGIGECGKALGRLVEQAFPNGFPDIGKGFDLAGRGPQLVDLPRGTYVELPEPVVILVANDA